MKRLFRKEKNAQTQPAGAPTKQNRSRHPLLATARLLIFRFLAAFLIGSVPLVLPLRWLPAPISSFMLQSYFLGPGQGPLRYTWIPYEAMSPYLGLAAVAAEDQHFPTHHGFDFGAIQQAWEDNEDGRSLRGGSTISQQVAKNLFLWPGRSYLRKALEAWFTLLIEIFWPKQRILEVYLNIVELGDNTFGVEAASQRFFGESAASLGPSQAALLASVLPNPRRFRVDKPSFWVRQRQAWISRQMRQLGGLAYLSGL